MIDATIKIAVPPQKRKELLQTFKMILDPIRKEQDCICCNCYVDIEDENIFFIMEEWQSREALDTHLQSALFAVLRGAMTLVNESPEIKVCTVASKVRVNEVSKARA